MGSVVIVGAGAIGAWLAVRLLRSGEEVTLLARPERALAIRADGLTLESAPVTRDGGQGTEDTVLVPPLKVVEEAGRLPNDPDLVVIATRAYQTAEAARDLVRGHVRPDTILTLQNGLGNAEAIAQHFEASCIVVGTTSHGVTSLGPTKVRHAGRGDTVIGPWDGKSTDRATHVAHLLSKAGVEASLVPDPRPSLWRKVAVNAAINPPTALHAVANGQLLQNDALAAELDAAAREVALVATAEGIPLDPDECVAQARNVAERTADNVSSMLQARRAGRPLETDAIVGVVVAAAERHGIETPTLRRHLDRLRALR